MALGAFEGWPEDRGLFRELGTGARIEVVAVGAKSPSSALGTFWSLAESGMHAGLPGLACVLLISFLQVQAN